MITVIFFSRAINVTLPNAKRQFERLYNQGDPNDPSIPSVAFVDRVLVSVPKKFASTFNQPREANTQNIGFVVWFVLDSLEFHFKSPV